MTPEQRGMDALRWIRSQILPVADAHAHPIRRWDGRDEGGEARVNVELVEMIDRYATLSEQRRRLPDLSAGRAGTGGKAITR